MYKRQVQLFVGEQQQLKLGGTPANATYNSPSDFTWRSSDEDVVTVDAQGKLTATGIGATTVTATSHNGLTEICIVSVTMPAGKITIEPVDAERADAVSYTHLDVYKRQPRRRTCRPERRAG